MIKCDNCGEPIEEIPFKCRMCAGHFCSRCRLPERHNCSELRKENIFANLYGLKKNADGHLYPKEHSQLPIRHLEYNSDISLKKPRKNSSSCRLSNLGNKLIMLIAYLILAMILANIFFPFVLLFIHPNMQLVVGNPKPVYFYDIEPSCGIYDTNIVSTLKHLSEETGVKFIRLPSFYALVIGGISYDCGSILTTPGAIGESEAGFIGGGGIIISWNKISLIYADEETILHETLHSLGFDHNANPESIMNEYHRGFPQVDADIIDFIRKVYVSNPFVYLNMLPINLFYEVLFLFAIINWITSKFS